MKRPRGRTFCRLYGAILIGAQALISASLTPVSSCTIDGAAAACMPGDPNRAQTTFIYNDGLGTDFLSIVVAASAGSGADPDTSGTASITLNFLATTEGPVRPGFVEYLIVADGDGSSAGASYGSKVSVSGIGNCSAPFTCVDSGTIPFQLGIPFEIRMSAAAGGTFAGFQSGAASDSTIELRFYELDSSGSQIPVNILGPIITPEPNSTAAMLVSALGLIWLRRRRNSGNL